MNRQDCESLLIKQGASKAEAQVLTDALLDEKRQVLASGGDIQKLSRQWSERALSFARETQRREYLKALGTLKYTEASKAIDSLQAEGASPEDAIRTFLAGQSTYRAGGRRSVSALREGIYNSWAGSMVNELEKVPDALRLIQGDKEFHDAVFMEMREPGTSKDARVKEIAGIFARHMERIRQDLNDAGAYIGHLEGWTPQNHDPYKILGANGENKKKWMEFIRERLDTDRTFPNASEQEILQALEGVYQDITLGKPMFLPETGGNNTSTIPARKFEHQRVLHFKDAQSALEYHHAYGRGNIFNAMMTHMDHAARSLSLLRTLGPNPEQTLEKLVAREDVKLRNAGNIDDLAKRETAKELQSSFRDGSIRNIMREVTGEINTPVNPTMAKVMNGLRMIQNMAKLGGATLSALADPFVKATQIRTVTGDNWLGAIFKSVTQYIGSYGPESRETARRLGALLDHLRIDIASRWDSNAGMEGRLGRMQQAFFKWSGLDWITERGKAGYTMFLSSEFGSQAGKAWADMNPSLRATLKFHGVDETRWNIMRKMVQQNGEYTYFLPELAQKLSDADLLPMLPQKYRGAAPLMPEEAAAWNRGRERALRDARNKIQFESMGMLADETRFAVLEPDDATRAMMRQGQRPGTPRGELWRAIMQFKGFPMAYMQRTLGGRRWVRMERQEGMRRGWNRGSAWDAMTTDMPGIVGFVLSSIAFGYAAGVCKDVVKGKTPRDPEKMETWMAAAMQSGGAGIFGDFLLGKVNRFGSSALETAAGPLLGTASDVIKIMGEAIHGNARDAGADLVQAGMANTPFVNLWYTKAGLDWALLYHVREMLSPGTLRRSEQKMKDEFNQKYLYPPSRYIKRGGGFISGI